MHAFSAHCVCMSRLLSDKLHISIQVDTIKTISMILGSGDTIEGSRYPASIFGTFVYECLAHLPEEHGLVTTGSQQKHEGGPGSSPGVFSNRDTTPGDP